MKEYHYNLKDMEAIEKVKKNVSFPDVK